MMYFSQIHSYFIMLYTLNLHSAIFRFYIDKTGRKIK